MTVAQYQEAQKMPQEGAIIVTTLVQLDVEFATLAFGMGMRGAAPAISSSGNAGLSGMATAEATAMRVQSRAGAALSKAEQAAVRNNLSQAAKKCKEAIEDVADDDCFTAGTQIVVGAEYTEDDVFVRYVTVDIEDVEVGDFVYSYDAATGETVLSEVTDVSVRESDHVDYLYVIDANGDEQIIETTDSHPFWVVTDEPDLSRAARSVVDENGVILYHENVEPAENGYWVEAKDLREGDVFLGANGELSTLVAKNRVDYADGITVYNFTVDGNHDYFVAAEGEYGQSCILVHNTVPCWARGKFEVEYVNPRTGAMLDYPRLHVDIPDHVPSDWGIDEIQAAIEELKISIANRNADMARYLEMDPDHVVRIQNEEAFLLQLERKLKDMGGGWS